MTFPPYISEGLPSNPARPCTVSRIITLARSSLPISRFLHFLTFVSFEFTVRRHHRRQEPRLPGQPRLGHDPVGLEQTLEGAAVQPQPVQLAPAHAAIGDVEVVDRRDLQLAPRRRRGVADEVEHARIVDIKAGHRVIALRLLRLLLDPDDLLLVLRIEDRDPILPRIGHLLEEEPGAVLETPHRRTQVGVGEVVAQHHHDGLPLREFLRDGERLRNPSLALLVAVLQVLHAQALARAQDAQEMPGMRAARDDEQMIQPGAHEVVDDVVNHAPVKYRQQVLVGGTGERIQPRAQPTGENDTLHSGHLRGI